MSEQLKFTYRDAINLSNVISQIIKKDIGSAKFKLRMVINQKNLADLVDPINKITTNSPKFSQYVKQSQEMRLALCQVHAEKDQNGKSKIQNSEYVILDRDAYNAAFAVKSAELRQQYKEQIEKRQQMQNQLLTTEYDIEDSRFKKIDESSLPEQLTTAQITALLPLVA